MKADRLGIGGIVARLALALFRGWCGSTRAADTTAPAETTGADSAASALLQPLLDDYMAGKWDDVAAALQAHAAEYAKLPRPQMLDLLYLKAALHQCRPAWWKTCKAGEKFNFSAAVWNKQIDTTFDPAVSQGVQFQSVGGKVHLTVSWNVTEMDDPKPAEHGFSKGELNQLTVWMALGTGEAWTELPKVAFLSTEGEQKVAMGRFLDFRGNVTGAYYSMPRARRWGFWLFTAAYMDKYAKIPTIMGRQALGAALLEEVAAHRALYPSIPLPEKVSAETAEKDVALALKAWIEKHPWTFAEDRSLREVIKRLATSNGKEVETSGMVALGNGLSMALDPQRDSEFRTKRNAWLTAKINGTAGAK